MKAKAIKKFCVFLVLFLALYPSTSVFASIDTSDIPRAHYIDVYAESGYNLEMTGSDTGVFHYKVCGANAVDITSKVPASRISIDAFVGSDPLGGSSGRRAKVSLDTQTGIATVTCDFKDTDKYLYVMLTYNSNPSMENFTMSDLATGSCSFCLNNTYDPNKTADIKFLSNYLTDTGNNTATFKYKASYAGRDITKTFPISLIEASTSVSSSITFDPLTGTGTIKFNSPMTDKIIGTTLSHKLTGVTSILNTSGLSKDPIKRQAPTEVSKINFVTGSIVKTDNETATFKYRVLDHYNSNITKTIPAADINASAMVGSEKAEVSIDPSTGTGTIKYNFTDQDKKATVTLTHKSGVEISAIINIVSSEAINDNDANNNDLQVAQIVFLPTGINRSIGHGAGLTYRIYNQYGRNITKEVPACNLAFSSSVNSTISSTPYTIGGCSIEYNTYDSDRTIIVCIMDKATGVKAAMNIGESPAPDAGDDIDNDTDSPTSGKIIKFNDAALEQAVRDLIHKQEADITEVDIKNITYLSVGMGCTDLSGIENLKNLTEIKFWGSNIKSLTLLKQLPNLRALQFTKGSINDIKTLTELTNLATLDIHYTEISDEDLSSLKKALPKCYILH